MVILLTIFKSRSQQTLIYRSKLTIKTLEEGVHMFKITVWTAERRH